MNTYINTEKNLDPRILEFYRNVISILDASGIPFLAGGAYALRCYTGIVRYTKDFDVFVRPRDVHAILEILARAGYKTELTDKVWLGKAFRGEDMIDVVFGSANGIAAVDDEWFAYSRLYTLLSHNVKLIPPEEMIWSKAFIMTRDRFDGADIVHMLLFQSPSMDWERLLRRFGPHWLLLYNHLLLFYYIYPSEWSKIPRYIMDTLGKRLADERLADTEQERMCRGWLLSTVDYADDVTNYGYIDARKKEAA